MSGIRPRPNRELVIAAVLAYTVMALGPLALPAMAAGAGSTARIAFERKQGTASNIDVMNADGSGIQPLTTAGTDIEPSFGPGGKIAFENESSATNSSAAGDVYVMNADGTGVQRLTTSGDTDSPSFGADGKIVFTRVSQSPTSFAVNIYIMNADGSGIQQLTTTGDADEPSLGPNGVIAFQRIVNNPGQLSGAESGNIYVMKEDGTGVQPLTTTGDAGKPSVGADGRIVFQRDNYSNSGNSDIFVMNGDGSGLQQVTMLGTAVHPSFGPGGVIAFTYVNNGSNVDTINADGSGRQALTTSGDADWPSFEPGPLHTYTGVGWHLVSSPYTLSQPSTTIVPNVFAYDPASQTYSIPSDSFHAGQGYWIYMKTSSLDIPGPGTPTDSSQPFTIPLSPGWNIVGEPFTTAVPLSQISVVDGAGNKTAFSAATDPTAKLVSPLYTWDPNAGMYNLLNTDAQTLNPWDGAWVYAKQSGLSLVVQASAVSGSPTPRAVQRRTGWTVQVFPRTSSQATRAYSNSSELPTPCSTLQPSHLTRQ